MFPKDLNALGKSKQLSHCMYSFSTLEIAAPGCTLPSRSEKCKSSVSRAELKMGISSCCAELMSIETSDGRCTNESGVLSWPKAQTSSFVIDGGKWATLASCRGSNSSIMLEPTQNDGSMRIQPGDSILRDVIEGGKGLERV